MSTTGRPCSTGVDLAVASCSSDWIVDLRRGPRRAAERAGQRERDDDRQEPPGIDAEGSQQPCEREAHPHGRRYEPVVADDEVPPEAPERPQPPHAPAPAVTVARRWRRSRRTSPYESSHTNPTTPSSDSSSPGQATPAPSAAQKQPKLVSITPTVYLIVFSGTRSSGLRTSTPTTATRATATAAPAIATSNRP